MFGDTVMGVDHHHFEHELTAVKNARGAKVDTDLDAEGLKEVVERYKKVYRAASWAMISRRIRWCSWNTRSKRCSRAGWATGRSDTGELNDIRGLRGTAVNVQSMVFGNMGDDSATGVAFTRNPSTGENKFYGEFLVNAQGEDVVAGIRTPLDCQSEMGKWSQEELAGIAEGQEHAGKAIQGRAGFRVHDRKGQAVHAADPHRQAHGGGGGARSPSTW